MTRLAICLADHLFRARRASRRLLGKLTGKSKASSKGSKQGKSGRGSAEPELVAIREEDLRVLSFIKSKNVPKGVSHLCWLQSPKSAAGELGVQPSDCCIQLYPHRPLRKGRALCLCWACSFGASGLQPRRYPRPLGSQLLAPLPSPWLAAAVGASPPRPPDPLPLPRRPPHDAIH